MRVLDSAEVLLRAHADSVILVGELQADGWVVVEGPYFAGHACEVLQAPIFSYLRNCCIFAQQKKIMLQTSVRCVAGDLVYLDFPASAEGHSARDHR